MIGGEERVPFREEDVDAGHVCGQGMAEVEDEGERGHREEQTTWIRGLNGWPDRVNQNNSEQKTASLLTFPLLDFHWQFSNKHMLSSKTFMRT